MKETFETIYSSWDSVFSGNTIDLSEATFLDPWVTGLVCLKAVENMNKPDKKVLLPQSPDVFSYMKRMHLDEVMSNLSYAKDVEKMLATPLNERENLNVCEIAQSAFRDEFSARLSSRIRLMFRNFGMNEQDEQRATALVGELGNNVYDHNEGAWPTDARGSFIVAQHWPEKNRIDVVVADPGIGFRGSLRVAKPELDDDLEAIQFGLQGVTGRVGERRGNGLRVIQNWTVDKFNGMLRIHSGTGFVQVDREGQEAKRVPPIIGTLAGLVVFYK